jgi:hypothetical protein
MKTPIFTVLPIAFSPIVIILSTQWKKVKVTLQKRDW